MGTAVLTLSIAYALPLAACMLLLAGAQPRRRVAGILLALLPVFYLLHYLGLQQLLGWPSDAAPPQRFELLAEQVVEPEPQRNAPGAVYLWLREPGDDRPRAYRLPYTKPLHQEVAAAGQRRADGRPQLGERRTPTAQSQSGDGGRTLSFRDQPPASLPHKAP
jgi:hypothetical protein